MKEFGNSDGRFLDQLFSGNSQTTFEWQLDKLNADLPPIQLGILKRFHCRKNSLNEIALHFGISINDVSRHIFLAHKKLERTSRKKSKDCSPNENLTRDKRRVCLSCGTYLKSQNQDHYCPYCLRDKLKAFNHSKPDHILDQSQEDKLDV